MQNKQYKYFSKVRNLAEGYLENVTLQCLHALIINVTIYEVSCEFVKLPRKHP